MHVDSPLPFASCAISAPGPPHLEERRLRFNELQITVSTQRFDGAVQDVRHQSIVVVLHSDKPSHIIVGVCDDVNLNYFVGICVRGPTRSRQLQHIVVVLHAAQEIVRLEEGLSC